MNLFGREIRAVIFDMDGTLLDSERLSQKAWDAGAREFGLSVSAELFLKMVGHRTVDCLRILEENCGSKIPQEAIGVAANRHYNALVDAGVPVMPGARECVDFFRENAIPLGLATSTRRVNAEKKMIRAGLWEFFSAATCGDEVALGKPNPEIYAATAEKLGVPAENCLAIEDSPTGWASAHACGCAAILVPDMVEPTAFARENAVAIFRNLRELASALRTKNA